MERSVQFADEWLNLGHLANLRPDKQHFPNWNPALAGDMRAETIAFFKDCLETKPAVVRSVECAFTHLTPPWPSTTDCRLSRGEGPQRYDLTKAPRAAACSRRAAFSRAAATMPRWSAWSVCDA